MFGACQDNDAGNQPNQTPRLTKHPSLIEKEKDNKADPKRKSFGTSSTSFSAGLKTKYASNTARNEPTNQNKKVEGKPLPRTSLYQQRSQPSNEKSQSDLKSNEAIPGSIKKGSLGFKS